LRHREFQVNEVQEAMVVVALESIAGSLEVISKLLVDNMANGNNYLQVYLDHSGAENAIPVTVVSNEEAQIS
jgi:hypothetical protein